MSTRSEAAQAAVHQTLGCKRERFWTRSIHLDHVAAGGAGHREDRCATHDRWPERANWTSEGCSVAVAVLDALAPFRAERDNRAAKDGADQDGGDQ